MVSAIVLGGLNGDRSRHLLRALLADPSIAFVRIVDRFLVVPPSLYTFYCDEQTRQAFSDATRDGKLEYIQANLLVEASRIKAFAVLENKRWDWCFDFTGETDPSATDQVHVERTFKLALSLSKAALAANANIVYVRHLESFYRTTSSGGAVGDDDGAISLCWGKRAEWHHATARALAQTEGLKVVFVRTANMYGPSSVTGLSPRCLLAEVYKYLGEPLQFLWSADLDANTIHVDDWAWACIAVARWAAAQDDVVKSAGEPLVPVPKDSSTFKTLQSNVSDYVHATGDVQAACFTIVDDDHTTQATLARLIGEAFGINTSFHSSVINAFAKLNLAEVVEDANDKHVEAWGQILVSCDPPLTANVPVSPVIVEDMLKPYGIKFSNDRLKRLTSWAPQHHLTAQVLRDTIDGFKKEGLWPSVKPSKPRK